ncbi:hypothetical protein DHBDCA_p1341 [Dehalobacter sp. DCA]|nr:hypothetical protein DHBDCA_p1341 [Dehalobacter sp. DCA]
MHYARQQMLLLLPGLKYLYPFWLFFILGCRFFLQSSYHLC